ncbi:hypothetical protein ABDZ15_08260 [Mycobacterium canetti]
MTKPPLIPVELDAPTIQLLPSNFGVFNSGSYNTGVGNAGTASTADVASA